jgi:hypothetical protein
MVAANIMLNALRTLYGHNWVTRSANSYKITGMVSGEPSTIQ